MRKYQVNRLSFLLLVMLTAVVMIQPLRLAFMDLVLPTAWVDTDNIHLYHVVNDYQNFDVDVYSKQRDTVWSRVQANMTQFDTFLQLRENAYQEFHHYFQMLKSLPQRDSNFQEKMELISTFKPIMTPYESAQLLFTFDIFTKACMEADLNYFILEASLMGVIRHHGFIPWDDDIDVVMSAKQWRKIRDVLGDIEGFELFSPADSQWKFYITSATSFPDKPFKFPNIDIFFYDEDETHIWALTRGLKHDLVFLKSDIFPLQFRPFEHLMVPVPCNLDLVVHKSHNKDICITLEYNHKTNKNFYFHGTTAVNCKILYDLYPFVFTIKSRRRGYQDEFLKIGTKVIQRKRLPVGCQTEPSLTAWS